MSPNLLCISSDRRQLIHPGGLYTFAYSSSCLHCSKRYTGVREIPSIFPSSRRKCGSCTNDMGFEALELFWATRFVPLNQLGVTEEEVRKLYQPEKREPERKLTFEFAFPPSIKKE